MGCLYTKISTNKQIVKSQMWRCAICRTALIKNYRIVQIIQCENKKIENLQAICINCFIYKTHRETYIVPS
jgi:hypothetical protein